MAICCVIPLKQLRVGVFGTVVLTTVHWPLVIDFGLSMFPWVQTDFRSNKKKNSFEKKSNLRLSPHFHLSVKVFGTIATHNNCIVAIFA